MRANVAAGALQFNQLFGESLKKLSKATPLSTPAQVNGHSTPDTKGNTANARQLSIVKTAENMTPLTETKKKRGKRPAMDKAEEEPANVVVPRSTGKKQKTISS